MATDRPRASKATLNRIAKALARPVSRYIPNRRPTVKQAAALIALELRRAVLYGGAAGGGKSDWLLMAALQYVHCPGYHAIIFRRTFPQLNAADGLILRLRSWLVGSGATWNNGDHRWTFPSGATLTLSHMQHLNDREDHQGAAYHFVGFDELTQFEEGQFTYLFSRARRPSKGPGSEIPVRVAATANPGGLGHEWVSRAWGLGDWEGSAQGFGKAGPEALAFIPAKLEDNPHLDTEDYEQTLMFLPEVERSRLRDGDWKSKPVGDLVPTDRFILIDETDVPENLTWLRFWDFAATEERKKGRQPDFTSSCFGAYDRETERLYVAEGTLDRLGPAGVEALFVEKSEEDGDQVDIWMEQEPGSSGVMVVAHMQKLVPGRRLTGKTESGAKRTRWLGVRACVEQHRAYFVRGPTTTRFLDHIAALTTDEKADGRNDVKDDGMDSLAGMYRAATNKRKFWYRSV